jgi:hypothetical protein
VKIGTRLAAATIGCILLILGLTLPAQAHDLRANLYACAPDGHGFCGFGQERDHHQVIDACDQLADGHGLYVKYTLFGGREGKVGDANGSKSGCGIQSVGNASAPIVRFNVCIDVALITDPCTGWVWA